MSHEVQLPRGFLQNYFSLTAVLGAQLACALTLISKEKLEGYGKLALLCFAASMPTTAIVIYLEKLFERSDCRLRRDPILKMSILAYMLAVFGLTSMMNSVYMPAGYVLCAFLVLAVVFGVRQTSASHQDAAASPPAPESHPSPSDHQDSVQTADTHSV